MCTITVASRKLQLFIPQVDDKVMVNIVHNPMLSYKDQFYLYFQSCERIPVLKKLVQYSQIPKSL